MPFGDGTGPLGQGPMTGRGLGYCAGNNAPGRFGGFGRGFGYGRGWGRGFGRGFGRGWGYRWYGNAPVDEKTALENRLRFLEEELKYTRERLKEIGEDSE
ncbi:conserved hypothetical protein [Thermotomaculum hydrothermale]|uniref:Cytoplasmic protein n=1 Tax=Thermotomaculum hydrothermale TaxID=981385 RepID=A0A7R6SXT4_9BACT|nr:DUF5320 domain-containing protein [Thermotomaculum hydrothermale]BBB31831.1 conserved hypothetical protein [Thermotomaculum hydrothermale]